MPYFTAQVSTNAVDVLSGGGLPFAAHHVVDGGAGATFGVTSGNTDPSPA
ncbi:hypothetical protein [Streptomyces sp. NPDC059349]